MILLEHLYQLVFEDLPHDFPPLTTGTAPPNNLPAQISSFIGRQAEIVRIKELIDLENPGRNRLVTLLGPGGTGKTRLSLQIGHELKNGFIGGTWFIELAPITNPELVPQTILTGVGLQADANRPALTVLGDYFREKIALLILDNCEHLVDVCAQICDYLLRACPHLHILTSSREVLGINGETIFPVPPLSLTRVKKPSPEDILSSEAGLLFVDRVTAVHPGFCVTTENAPDIAQLCSQLDGIPLAIELAAARTRVLTVDQIVTHLDDRFRLLTGGRRAVLPRHQTLKALVDWSWDLLTQNEQVLLRRLSVFAGGWDLDASEGIGNDPIRVFRR